MSNTKNKASNTPEILKTIKGNRIELSAFFPKDRLYTIHQNGSVLDKTGLGVRVVVTIPTESKMGSWEVVNQVSSTYFEGTLTFNGKLVTDYDGAFNLPPSCQAS